MYVETLNKMSSSLIFLLILLAVECLTYDDGLYHPYGYDDGQYRRPRNEGKYVPGFEGKYIPDSEGQYIPGFEGKYIPDLKGQYKPDFEGKYIPGLEGKYIPDLKGKYIPDYEGKYIPSLEGKYAPDFRGIYIPDFEGKYIPGLEGKYIPDFKGKYIPDLEGKYIPDFEGKYIPDLKGIYIPDFEGKYIPGFDGKYIPGFEGYYMSEDEGEYADNGDYRYVHQEGPMGGFGGSRDGEGQYQPGLYLNNKYIHREGPRGGTGGYGAFGGNGSYGGVGGLGPNGPLGPTGPSGPRGSKPSYRDWPKKEIFGGPNTGSDGKYDGSSSDAGKYQPGPYSRSNGSYKHQDRKYVYRERPSEGTGRFGADFNGPSGPPGPRGSAPLDQNGPKEGIIGGRNIGGNGKYDGSSQDEGKYQLGPFSKSNGSYKHQDREYVHREGPSGETGRFGAFGGDGGNGGVGGFGPSGSNGSSGPKGSSGPPGPRGPAHSDQDRPEKAIVGGRNIGGNGKYDGSSEDEGKYKLELFSRRNGSYKYQDREYVHREGLTGGTGRFGAFGGNGGYGGVAGLGPSGPNGPAGPNGHSGPPGPGGSAPSHQDGPKKGIFGGRIIDSNSKYDGSREDEGKYQTGFYTKSNGSYTYQDRDYVHREGPRGETGENGPSGGNGSHGSILGPHGPSGLPGRGGPASSHLLGSTEGIVGGQNIGGNSKYDGFRGDEGKYTSGNGSYKHQDRDYVHQEEPSGKTGGNGPTGGNGSHGSIEGFGQHEPNDSLGPKGPSGLPGRGGSASSHQGGSKIGIVGGGNIGNGKYNGSRGDQEKHQPGFYLRRNGSYNHRETGGNDPFRSDGSYGGMGGFGSVSLYQDGPVRGFGGGRDIGNVRYNGSYGNERKYQSGYDVFSGNGSYEGVRGFGPNGTNGPLGPLGPDGPLRPSGCGVSAPSYQDGAKGGFGERKDVSSNDRYNGSRRDEGKYRPEFYSGGNGSDKHQYSESRRRERPSGETGGYSGDGSYRGVGGFGPNKLDDPLGPNGLLRLLGRGESAPLHQDGSKEGIVGGRNIANNSRYDGSRRDEEKYQPAFYSRVNVSYKYQDKDYKHREEPSGNGPSGRNRSHGSINEFGQNDANSSLGTNGSSEPPRHEGPAPLHQDRPKEGNVSDQNKGNGKYDGSRGDGEKSQPGIYSRDNGSYKYRDKETGRNGPFGGYGSYGSTSISPLRPPGRRVSTSSHQVKPKNGFDGGQDIGSNGRYNGSRGNEEKYQSGFHLTSSNGSYTHQESKYLRLKGPNSGNESYGGVGGFVPNGPTGLLGPTGPLGIQGSGEFPGSTGSGAPALMVLHGRGGPRGPPGSPGTFGLNGSLISHGILKILNNNNISRASGIKGSSSSPSLSQPPEPLPEPGGPSIFSGHSGLPDPSGSTKPGKTSGYLGSSMPAGPGSYLGLSAPPRHVSSSGHRDFLEPNVRDRLEFLGRRDPSGPNDSFGLRSPPRLFNLSRPLGSSSSRRPLELIGTVPSGSCNSIPVIPGSESSSSFPRPSGSPRRDGPSVFPVSLGPARSDSLSGSRGDFPILSGPSERENLLNSPSPIIQQKLGSKPPPSDLLEPPNSFSLPNTPPGSSGSFRSVTPSISSGLFESTWSKPSNKSKNFVGPAYLPVL